MKCKKYKIKNGFTLAEVIIAGGIAVAMLGFVLTMYTWGVKGFARINWHSNANRNGSRAANLIQDSFNRASAPSVIRANGVDVSEEYNKVVLPSGLEFKTIEAKTIIIYFPVSTSSIPQEGQIGKVNWHELLLLPASAGLSSLYLRNSQVEYTNHNSVSNPKDGALQRLISDVESLALSYSDRSLSIDITTAFPNQKSLKQNFLIEVPTRLEIIVE